MDREIVNDAPEYTLSITRPLVAKRTELPVVEIHPLASTLLYIHLSFVNGVALAASLVFIVRVRCKAAVWTHSSCCIFAHNDRNVGH